MRTWFHPFEHCNRRPHVRRIDQLSAFKAGRRHTDDSELMIVEGEVLADKIRVCSKPALPKAVTNYHDGVRQSRLILLRQKGAALNCLHSEHVEVVARYLVAPNALVVSLLT